MMQLVRASLGALVAGSLMWSSAAGASASAASVQQANPWGVLSAMSGGAPAAALCGAAVAAAQSSTGCVLPALDATPPVAAPPAPTPVPPISAPSGGLGLGINPLLLGLLALAAGVGIYFAVRHHGNSPT